MNPPPPIECSVPGCTYVTPSHICSASKQIKLLEIHSTANHPVQSLAASLTTESACQSSQQGQGRARELEAREAVQRVRLHQMVQQPNDTIEGFVARLSGAAKLCGMVGNISYGDVVMKSLVINGMFNKEIRDRVLRRISNGELGTLSSLVHFISEEEADFVDLKSDFDYGKPSEL